jgi:AmiR/NasT family two-component response regulator
VSVSELDQLVELNGDGPAVEQLRTVARALLERNRQLEQALQSRILIEQAKGMLAERFSVPPDDAFEVLRRAARNHRIRVHDLAGRVIAERETPPEILEARR